MKRFLFFSLFLTFFFLKPVNAAEFFGGDQVVIPPERTIEGSIFAGGESVVIQGHIKGDVYCAGKEIVISGEVEGDVLCGGQKITLEGNVHGDARVGGQLISFSGNIDGNITTGGQTVSLLETASISGELVAAAQNMRIWGDVKQGVTGWAEKTDIYGNIGKNVDINTETLNITETASIAGTITRREPSKKIDQPKQNRLPQRWNGGAYIIISLLTGGLLLLVSREKMLWLLGAFESRWVNIFGWGLLASIGIPIALILVAITIIGIPFSLIGVFLFALLYFVGRSLIALWVGKKVAERFLQKNNLSHGWWLVLGVFVHLVASG